MVEQQKSSKKILQIFLKYQPNGKPLIEKIVRASKPGLRRYSSVDDLPMVMNGLGIALFQLQKELWPIMKLESLDGW